MESPLPKSWEERAPYRGESTTVQDRRQLWWLWQKACCDTEPGGVCEGVPCTSELTSGEHNCSDVILLVLEILSYYRKEFLRKLFSLFTLHLKVFWKDAFSFFYRIWKLFPVVLSIWYLDCTWGSCMQSCTSWVVGKWGVIRRSPQWENTGKPGRTGVALESN